MCELRVDGKPVPVSLGQIRILARLLEAEGRVVARSELYQALGGGVLNTNSRAIDIHIARIRHALGELGRFVIAVRGRGYRINIAGLAEAARYR